MPIANWSMFENVRGVMWESLLSKMRGGLIESQDPPYLSVFSQNAGKYGPENPGATVSSFSTYPEENMS